MLITDTSHLRRGMLVAWEWADNPAGQRGRTLGLRPLGRILTQGDIPAMKERFALQVEDAPVWRINPIAAIEQGRRLNLLRAVEPPEVLNAKQCGKSRPGATYIGRPSQWGNPFKINKNGDREKVMQDYISWLHGNPEFVLNVRKELAGRHLICWCHPEFCHGHVLRDIAMGADLPPLIDRSQPDLFGG